MFPSPAGSRGARLVRALVPALSFTLVACGADSTSGIRNKPPVAKAGPDASAGVGQEVRFDGSGSTDPDGTVASFAWTFGDGAAGTGATVTHAFAQPGAYHVKLTVADDEGATGADELVVEVKAADVDQPPVADLQVSANAVLVNVEVAFDGSGSTDDGSIAAWVWDFGDGASATTAKATHKYAAAGAFTVRLTVTDDHGLTGEASTVVRVQAPPPPPPPPPTTLPTTSKWSYGLVDPSQKGQCGGFQAAELTFTIPNPAGPTSSLTISEAGGFGGATVYSGTYQAATRHFSATHSGTGVTETLEGTFDATFTHFTGSYVVDAMLVCSAVSRAITGTRTSPP